MGFESRMMHFFCDISVTFLVQCKNMHDDDCGDVCAIKVGFFFLMGAVFGDNSGWVERTVQ